MPTQRQRKKAAVAATQARYDASGNGRRIAHWNPGNHGPQRAVEGRERMLARTRDSVRNDWAAESSVGKWTSTLVGVGIQPRWKAKDIRPVYDRWVKTADADGVLNFYGLQAIATRSWMESGEVFLRRRARRASFDLEVPTQMQVLESEFCPLFDADSWPGMPVGNTIQQGIERDRSGQRTAYWFYKDHPGDKARNGNAPTSDQLVRVAASQVAHLYEPKRPGALRGVTPLSSVLIRLRNSADFEDAVLDRQKLANLFMAFITKTMPSEWDIDYDSTTGLPKFYDQSGTPVVGLQSGATMEMRPGENVTFANPPESGTSYPDYMRSSTLGTAAGQHMPYEYLTGDIRDVSDRTLRLVVQEFRRFAQQRQWLFLIPQMCQRAIEWFAGDAIMAGVFQVGRYDEISAPEWAPHAWDYIHPVQDAQGKKILEEMGVVSKTGLILERGDDPDKIREERAADKKADEKAGLGPPKPLPKQASPVQQAQARLLDAQALALVRGDRGPQAQQQPPSEIATVLSSLATIVAQQQQQAASMLQAFADLASKLADRPTTVQAHVAVEPTPIQNSVVVQPTPIQNNVTVEPTPVNNTVNVEPTPVNNTVNVQPAEVLVHLPDRQIVSDITREGGEIVKVIQTETTLEEPTKH